MLKANNELCLNCKQPHCDGICDALIDDMGSVKRSRLSKTVTWRGITRSITEWAEILGISRQTLYRRLNDCDDIEETMAEITNSKAHISLPHGAIEQTLIQLSTMPLDYALYWKLMKTTDGSQGMIAKYGKIQTAPTNRVSNPTEGRAMPELSMSDEALNKRAWIACVIYTIEDYRNASTHKHECMIRADMLQWRAIDGMSLKKICETLNEIEQRRRPFTILGIKRMMEKVIETVAENAVKRGLIV